MPNRNGTWYSALDAKRHLERKLKYLLQRTTPQSAEEFIDMVATGSSSSGRRYRVRCGEAPPVHSDAWMKGQLDEIRRATRNR